MSDRPLLEPLARIEKGETLDEWELKAFVAEVRLVLKRAQMAEEMYENLCELRDEDNARGAAHIHGLKSRLKELETSLMKARDALDQEKEWRRQDLEECRRNIQQRDEAWQQIRKMEEETA